MTKVTKYVVYDIIRNQFVMGYTLLLLVMSLSFYSFEPDPNKGLLSMLNIILLTVPLVSIIFSTIHFYNSYEFLELLSAQPISRKTIFFGQYVGVCISLGFAFVLGVGLPTFIFDGTIRGLTLISSGLLLSLVFVSIAFFAAVITRDKAKGIGISMALWFYLCILYDGLVLSILLGLADYPMEKASLAFTIFNPTDLARILVLMQLDVSALLGITGAIFQQFFTSNIGISIAFTFLVLWIFSPIIIAFKLFNKKDL